MLENRQSYVKILLKIIMVTSHDFIHKLKMLSLPADRVIGSGTNLDTARLHFFIGEKLNIPPNSVHGWIIGEHGDSSGT